LIKPDLPTIVDKYVYNLTLNNR